LTPTISLDHRVFGEILVERVEILVIDGIAIADQ
jgi:hypothetical protein